MKELTFDEAKKIQIGILDVVADFCEERGIKYWLNGGTLLGAVRHKGFIPWDDDIDISMLRPDYERFTREFNGCNPRYKFRCPKNDSSYPRPFGRVFDTHTLCVYDTSPGFDGWGMSIDVFVHDNAPDDDETVKEMYRKRDFWHRINLKRARRIFLRPKGNILRRLCVYCFRAALRLMPMGYCSRRIDRLAKSYDSVNTKRIGNFTGYDPFVVSKKAVETLIDLEFEGKMYKAPAGYDEWLTQNYGDYMTPPNPEERKGHAPFTLYMKD